NEVLHIMTSSRNYILRMEAQDGYRLLVTNYNEKSSAFDRFSYVHNNYFSTFDVDNDKWELKCNYLCSLQYYFNPQRKVVVLWNTQEVGGPMTASTIILLEYMVKKMNRKASF
ncbi:hypothetical protein Avbf_18229, partial [Armadillidium vulgare]